MNLALLADIQRLQDAGNPIPWQLLFYAGPAESWLDLGSNDGRTHNGCDRGKITAVELFPESVAKLRAQGYARVYHEDMRGMAAKLADEGQRFERVTATDVIEHIPKADGYKLIAEMERLASREIMIMMPIETPELAATQDFQDFREWGLSQHPDKQRELHDHRSQWSPADLDALGYQTAVLPRFHGVGGFHFDAFVAVKTTDPADLEAIIARVNEYGNSEGQRREWGYLGKSAAVVEPLMVNGGNRMFIGERTFLAQGARLEAIVKHNGDRYQGQIIIGEGSSAELFCHIGSAGRVTIGRDVMIGGHVTILDHDHGYLDYSRPPRWQALDVRPTTIGEGAWLGEYSFIGKGVNVGKGAIVGAHAVVTKDVPAYAVVAGNPAKVIKHRHVAPGLTSIIVVTVDPQSERVKRCLASIAAHTPEWHHVELIDNSQHNEGWVKGVNRGLFTAPKESGYYCLLNDDTEVTKGWLGRLLGTLERYPSCGLVGPVSDNVSGEQMVGAGYSCRLHWGESYETQRLVGFCLLLRREVYERLGGLDERFGLGNFDDDDYCLRALQAGYRLRVVRDCLVHHEGGATFRELGIDYNASLAENQAKFVEKWQVG